MILIDTSAWIEFFRRKGDPLLKSRVMDSLASNKAAYTCPVRFELILGARPKEMTDLLTGLDLARRIVLTPLHWDSAAALGAKLSAKGVRIPAADLLIAVVAVQEKLPLLTKDYHFTLLQEKLLPDLILS